MAIDALKQIREAEAAAENIKKQASIKAREKIKTTASQTEIEFNSTVEEAHNLASKLIKEKEAEARDKTKPILESGEKECIQLKNVSDEKVKKAVDLVIERIVKFYGKS